MVRLHYFIKDTGKLLENLLFMRFRGFLFELYTTKIKSYKYYAYS